MLASTKGLRLVSRHRMALFSTTNKGHSLGNAMTFYPADAPKQQEGKRSLAVISGWLNANPRQLKPYVAFYNKLGK